MIYVVRGGLPGYPATWRIIQKGPKTADTQLVFEDVYLYDKSVLQIKFNMWHGSYCQKCIHFPGGINTPRHQENSSYARLNLTVREWGRGWHLNIMGNPRCFPKLLFYIMQYCVHGVFVYVELARLPCFGSSPFCQLWNKEEFHMNIQYIGGWSGLALMLEWGMRNVIRASQFFTGVKCF